MRILMLPDYRRDNPYQSLLVKALESKGVQVDFWYDYVVTFPIFHASVRGKTAYKIVHLHWINSYLKDKKGQPNLLCYIKFIIDIIITRLAGVKIVWTIHNHISHDSKYPRLELWVRKILAKLVNRIILHNKSTLELIAKEYGFNLAKAEVIPHGHYREIYSPLIDQIEARRELGLPLSGRIYLNQGLLRPYKGIERLLEIWSSNAAFNGDTLLIVGKPLDKAYGLKLKHLTERMKGVILHPEFVEDNKIYLFFSAADVVVLPFKKILTSGSLILAMSYSKPIVAPRLGGIGETLGKADSLLYDPEDDRGLLQALQKSTQVDIGELSKLTQEACDRLDWNLVAEKTLQVYQAATGCEK